MVVRWLVVHVHIHDMVVVAWPLLLAILRSNLDILSYAVKYHPRIPLAFSTSAIINSLFILRVGWFFDRNRQGPGCYSHLPV